jgi:hypothetical protein
VLLFTGFIVQTVLVKLMAFVSFLLHFGDLYVCWSVNLMLDLSAVACLSFDFSVNQPCAVHLVSRAYITLYNESLR